MRYFIHLAYNGSAYHGWQIQPNAHTVQAEIETQISKLMNQAISITGCGRTDTGVHAKDYYAHFEGQIPFEPEKMVYKLNKMLPADIIVFRVFMVNADLHARYTASSRTYTYLISQKKQPFGQDLYYHFSQLSKVDWGKVQLAMDFLKSQNEFFTFSKSDSDVEHYLCEMQDLYYKLSDDQSECKIVITANRFLRGMVRLLVGMFLNIGLGKYNLAEVRKAMAEQTRLKLSTSVPPQGLSLTKIEYPFMHTEGKIAYKH